MFLSAKLPTECVSTDFKKWVMWRRGWIQNIRAFFTSSGSFSSLAYRQLQYIWCLFVFLQTWVRKFANTSYGLFQHIKAHKWDMTKLTELVLSCSFCSSCSITVLTGQTPTILNWRLNQCWELFANTNGPRFVCFPPLCFQGGGALFPHPGLLHSVSPDLFSSPASLSRVGSEHILYKWIKLSLPLFPPPTLPVSTRSCPHQETKLRQCGWSQYLSGGQ